MERIWRDMGWPESWREGVIVLIVKKGEGREVRDYRKVTLMPTLYKVDILMLVEKLREEMEGRGIILRTQTGSRKRMGTLNNNVYVLNYVVNRQLRRAGGELVACSWI